MTARSHPVGGWVLFWLCAAAVLAMSAAIILFNADLVAGTRMVIRATARTSFALFLAAFLASPLATLAPNKLTRGLMRERRILGLSFAFSHAMHLAAIVAYGLLDSGFWPSRSALTNAPGTIGYVFIALLAATSFRVVSKHLTPAAWKRLHTVGIWVIAAAFGLAFLKRIPTQGALYAVFFSIFCAAVVVRLLGTRVQINHRKQARSTSSLPNLRSMS